MLQAVKETFNGKVQTFNICVLGALATITGSIKLESLEKVLAHRFASAFHENNKKALHLGAEMAKPLQA